jgi:hypothetical protein
LLPVDNLRQQLERMSVSPEPFAGNKPGAAARPHDSPPHQRSEAPSPQRSLSLQGLVASGGRAEGSGPPEVSSACPAGVDEPWQCTLQAEGRQQESQNLRSVVGPHYPTPLRLLKKNLPPPQAVLAACIPAASAPCKRHRCAVSLRCRRLVTSRMAARRPSAFHKDLLAVQCWTRRGQQHQQAAPPPCQAARK